MRIHENCKVNANPLAEDLALIQTSNPNLWEALRNKKIFLTGGTGFFGCWLLESFAWVNDQLNLNAKMLVLSRNPAAFLHKAPHLGTHPAISFHPGDITSFDFPTDTFDYVIHAATEASAQMNDQNPVGMINTIVCGTSRTLEFARQAEAKRFLLTSSGAVYGQQPSTLAKIKETYQGAPDTTNPGSAYGEAKRLAEQLCTSYLKQYGLCCTIARCFAFVGPYLPLDSHFAAGNFLRDALAGQPIRVAGDGTAYRSYMYAGDLVIWLWTILLQGQPGRIYNVGSDEAISIADLARAIASCFKVKPEVNIAKTPDPAQKPERYIPDIDRACKELALKMNYGLESSLRRTIAYHSPNMNTGG